MGDLVQAGQSYRMGSIAGELGKKEAQVQSKALGLELTQREADRKENLSRQLASVIATSGAKGVSAFEGSPLSVLRQVSRETDISSERDKFNTQLQQLTAKQRAKMNKQMGRASGIAGLVSAGIGTGATLAAMPSTPQMGSSSIGYDIGV